MSTNQSRKAVQVKLDLSLPEEAVLASSTVDLSENELAQTYQAELKKKFPEQKTRDQVADVVYTSFGWLETFRHLFIRSVNLAATLSYTPSFGVAGPILPFLGLFCGVRLLLDSIQLAWDVISPRTEEGRKLSYWNRIKNSLYTDGRAKRMRNDIAWFGVNLTCLLLAPLTFGASLTIPQIVLMSGFVFDTANEASQGTELTKRKKIIAEIDTKINHIDAEILELEQSHHHCSEQLTAVIQTKLFVERKLKLDPDNTVLQSQLQKCELQRDNLFQQKMDLTLDDTKADYQKKREALVYMKEKVQAETQSLKRTIIYSVVASFVVAAAMAVCIFCPVAIPVIVGAAIAVGVGSVLDGFGRKLFNKLKNTFSSKPKSVETKSDTVSANACVNKSTKLVINATRETSSLSVATTRSPNSSTTSVSSPSSRRSSYSQSTPFFAHSSSPVQTPRHTPEFEGSQLVA